MSKQLKQLPAGWVATQTGFRIDHGNGGSCELIRYPKLWVVLNTDPTGSKWAQSYPSFKQTLAAVLAD